MVEVFSTAVEWLVFFLPTISLDPDLLTLLGHLVVVPLVPHPVAHPLVDEGHNREGTCPDSYGSGTLGGVMEGPSHLLSFRQHSCCCHPH